MATLTSLELSLLFFLSFFSSSSFLVAPHNRIQTLRERITFIDPVPRLPAPHSYVTLPVAITGPRHLILITPHHSPHFFITSSTSPLTPHLPVTPLSASSPSHLLPTTTTPQCHLPHCNHLTNLSPRHSPHLTVAPHRRHTSTTLSPPHSSSAPHHAASPAPTTTVRRHQPHTPQSPPSQLRLRSVVIITASKSRSPSPSPSYLCLFIPFVRRRCFFWARVDSSFSLLDRSRFSSSLHL